jgi:hypothetical protein
LKYLVLIMFLYGREKGKGKAFPHFVLNRRCGRRLATDSTFAHAAVRRHLAVNNLVWFWFLPCCRSGGYNHLKNNGYALQQMRCWLR